MKGEQDTHDVTSDVTVQDLYVPLVKQATGTLTESLLKYKHEADPVNATL